MSEPSANTDPASLAVVSSTRGRQRDSTNVLVDSLANWLVAQALRDEPIESIFENTCVRLHAAGIPVSRVQVGFRVLHPLFNAQTLTWKHGQGVEQNNYMHNRDMSQWYQSPLYFMVENELPHLRRHLRGKQAMLDYEILEMLKADGYSDYMAFFIPFGETGSETSWRSENSGIVGSWATTRKGGFTDSELRDLQRVEQRLAVAFKINIQAQITRNILGAYLGPGAGDQVLDGRIQRGDGQVIRAVIWYSDMRNSTHLANVMDGQDFLKALNCYFESTAGAVLEHGGEVLRFIGDAVLAIFPISCDEEVDDACRTAIASALKARKYIDEAKQLRASQGMEELDFGLGLHIGEVLFGNIGVPERVEFSVIGPAANEVARIESMTKELGHRILVSKEVADCVDLEWTDAGHHELKGVGRPLDLSALPENLEKIQPA